jgi:hypothetical protein
MGQQATHLVNSADEILPPGEVLRRDDDDVHENRDAVK